MKKTDLAYVAGIIDGEGSISLTKRLTKKGNEALSLVVTVTNTNIWLLEWLKFAFDGGVSLGRDGHINNTKPVYTWSICSMKALEFLELIYPYLRLKKPQAEIALKFLKMRGQKGRRFTPEEKVIGESQRVEMSNLNKRGAKINNNNGG